MAPSSSTSQRRARPAEEVTGLATDQLGGKRQIFGRVRPQDELRVVEGDFEGDFVAVTDGSERLEAAVDWAWCDSSSRPAPGRGRAT